MKNNFKLALLFLTLIFVFSSCKDKEDEVKPEPRNELVYGDSTYPVTSSTQVHYGKNDSGDTYNFDLALLTKTLTITTNSADTTFVGKGDILYLSFNTNTPFFLASGTYHLLDDETSLDFGLSYGYMYLDEDAADLNDDDDDSDDRPNDEDGFTSGTVVVVRNNNEYTLTVEGVTESGLTIKADYTGTPVFYDF